MSDDLVTKIARAVLYEGYLLYPYRPSVKSCQRWTFGSVRRWVQSHVCRPAHTTMAAMSRERR